MKSISLSFILAAFFCIKVKAQKNFQTGQIISLNGDTIQGEVDYRNWEKNPRKVSFRPGADQAVTTYSVTEIKGFRVVDDIYMSAVVQRETSPYFMHELEYNDELKFVQDTVFLQGLYVGSKSLFFYKDKNGKELFYILEDQTYKLLVSKQYLQSDGSREVLKMNLTYINQLREYLKGNPRVTDNILRMEYTKKDMNRVFKLYYGTQKKETAYSSNKEKLKAEIGVVAGPSFTKLAFSTGARQFDYIAKADYGWSTGIAGGVFFDCILPRNRGKWSINNEIFFSTYEAKGKYKEYVNDERHSTNYITLGLSYIKMNNMVRFKYPVGSMFLFANAGMSNGWAVGVKNENRIDRKFYTTDEVIQEKALEEIRNYELGWLAGVGARFKKYSVEIRCEKGNGMSDYVYLAAKTTRLQCLLGFRF